MAANRVNFVDEDDARRILLALFEKIAHAARAYAHKHFHKVRAGNRKERHVRLAGNRPRQQRLARSRRSDQQHAFRDTPAKLLEFLWILQELNDFLQLFLGFIRSCNILKCRLLLLRGKQPRPRLPETQRLIAAGLHLPHQEQTESDKQNQRRSVEQNQNPIAAAHFLHLDLNRFVFEFLGQVRSGFLEYRDMELAIRRASILSLKLVAVRREVHGDFFDVAIVHLGHELAVARLEFARPLSVGGHQSPEHHAQEHDRYPEQNRLRCRTRIHVILTFVPSPRVLPLAARITACLSRPYRFPESGFIDKPFWLRPIPLDAANPYPTHNPLDAVRNPK